MATQTLMTLEEFDQLDHDAFDYELDEGELITMAKPRGTHAGAGARITGTLITFVGGNSLGRVFIDLGCLFKTDPLIERAPDVAVVLNERLKDYDLTQPFPGAPDLCVEVVSPYESAAKLQRKVNQYLEHGARVVWVFYPDEREVQAYEGKSVRLVRAGEILDAPDVLPRFSVPLDLIFK